VGSTCWLRRRFSSLLGDFSVVGRLSSHIGGNIPLLEAKLVILWVGILL
jgi:hypothetical protein